MDVRFVDCRPRENYLSGHVPGAVWADTERDLTGTVGGGRHPLPDADAFAAWASRAGIEEGVLVVALDGGTGWAARLWWLLRHYGHDDAGVLRHEDWRGALRGGEETVEPREFVARPRSDDVVSADELLERLGDDRLVLVDARAPERWRGEVEPLDRVAGRIPGARNLPFTDAFPPPPELLEADELVVYCGSGVTASVDALALVLAGRPDVRLYPGSWSEWCGRGLPLERGP
ncbi:MAG TPA: sulfurtransferase [Gaiellaceae bacterium]|nr:sulfurtransferase [Gaiellaceae bacterium]